MHSFENKSGKSVVESTLSELRSKIISGELKPNEMLPPERELAEKMYISRSSLHQVILELQYQGFVKIIPRCGTIVCDFRKFPTSQSLNALMSIDSLKINYPLFNDMVEFRIFVESECVRLACKNKNPSLMKELTDLLNEISKNPKDLFSKTYLFHYKLTQLSGNSIYPMIFLGFESTITGLIEAHYSSHPEDINISNNLRRKLLLQIETGNADDAVSNVSTIINIGIKSLRESYEK